MCGEPWCLSIHYISTLTDYQIRALYGEKTSTGASQQEIFYAVWREAGLTEWEIEQKWQAYLVRRAQPAKPAATQPRNPGATQDHMVRAKMRKHRG